MFFTQASGALALSQESNWFSFNKGKFKVTLFKNQDIKDFGATKKSEFEKLTEKTELCVSNYMCS